MNWGYFITWNQFFALSACGSVRLVSYPTTAERRRKKTFLGRKIHAKKYIKKIDLKTHQTISLNRVRSKFEEVIFLIVVQPKI